MAAHFLKDGDFIPVSAENPLPVTGGSGGTSGGATEAKQDSEIAMLSEIATIMNELNTDFGMPSEPSWSGSGSGHVIGILKAIHDQNISIISLLDAIKTNTTAAG